MWLLQQNNGFLRGDREGMKEFNSDWKVYEALCGSEVVTYDYFLRERANGRAY
jgi:hypothetical protein